ncbi:hypothetical protein V8C35DRAFT_299078 [Trichoderma chlorosporum]
MNIVQFLKYTSFVFLFLKTRAAPLLAMLPNMLELKIKRNKSWREFSVAQCACCVVLRRVLRPPPKHGPIVFIIKSRGIVFFESKRNVVILPVIWVLEASVRALVPMP